VEKVKIYTGTQHNKTVNMWGETATFNSDGEAEVSEAIAIKAAKSVPADYSLTKTGKRIGATSSFSHQKSGDGVGKRAASVVERELKAKLKAQKEADANPKTEEPEEEVPTVKKTTKKTKKKTAKKTVPEDETEAPPSDQNPQDEGSQGEGEKPNDIWK